MQCSTFFCCNVTFFCNMPFGRQKQIIGFILSFEEKMVTFINSVLSKAGIKYSKDCDL